ncbi:MAG TPA: mechanosensitive ion channel domain-containing protein [Ferruginibacter sp.]|jgi:potassium efflux system protein|nr:mechanosensitive ion channel domain-containing protein [Ferruginibacter sp.]
MTITFYRKKYVQYISAIIIGCMFLLQSAFAQAILHNKIEPQHIISENDTLVPALVNKVATYSLTIRRSNSIVQRSLNVTPIITALPGIEKRLDAFRVRIDKKGFQMNLRSLNSALILIKESQNDLTIYEANLSYYSDQLTKGNIDVKEIIKDPVFTLKIDDSDLVDQLSSLDSKAIHLDSVERIALARVTLLRNQVSVDILQANDLLSDLNYRVVSVRQAMWGEEEPPLFSATPNDYREDLVQATKEAFDRSEKIIVFYLADKWNLVTLGFLLFILIMAWCMSNMWRIKHSDDATSTLEPVNFLKRSVLIGCLMSFFIYSPFFFGNPPMSYLHANEVFRLAALCYLLFPYLTRQSKLLWIGICGLWIYYVLDDILLESAFGERWGLFIAGILLIIVCIKIIQYKKNHFVKIPESPAAKALAIFTLTQVVLSIVFNLTGRVSLAKIFGVSAIQCFVLGVTLKVFCAMVLEAIYIQSEAYRESRLSNFINFKELQSRFQKVLWVVASVVWAVSLIRDLTLYDQFTDLVITFFTTPRSIGSIAFTFESVAVFFVIIWVSSVISGFISFFFGTEKVAGKQSRIGSMMLLIRLAIWTVGFFIAIAAAGIPLDKLSLIIGALGVGIGFGLQNIVNNLVSGVIIAFERPIQIGDQIEVGGKAGTVQEIGVRSSKIRNGQGADIIIPNGDLLSQPLINWTMHDLSKQVEFTITVPLDVNVQKVKTIMTDTLKKSEYILQNPAPVVILQTFVDNGIDIRVLFWIPDLSKSGSTRSNVMIQILDALNKEGISLVLPTTDAPAKPDKL